VRVRGTGVTDKPKLPVSRVRRRTRATPSDVGRGRFAGRIHRVSFYRWDDVAPGAHASGPAVITGGEATVVIPPDFRFRVDGHRNVIATRARVPASRPRKAR